MWLEFKYFIVAHVHLDAEFLAEIFECFPLNEKGGWLK